ncbi:MAG: Gfo/Idh/MocA family oxidoreductase [Phycisphaerales bacterium]|nr:Gfo/Idh/MocA family oxidoreductase [Phycisphaerales bacterium]
MGRENGFSRRDFLAASAGLAAAAGAGAGPLSIARAAHVAGSDALRLGVIGCGGRGTGAAADSLDADPAVKLVALADVFQDRLDGCLGSLSGEDRFKGRIAVDESHRFVGFDAYKQLLASEVDIVALATAPHFRAMHFEAAIAAGKHVFMEKPVGVDPTAVRRVLAAADQAQARKLCVVAGTQRRHQPKYRALMERVHGGAIGKIVSARAWWNQGGLWVKQREPQWSDMEWMLRNWLYFTWTSGDHIVEQHVHNLDVINWAVGTHPVKATAMGGRQVRTGPEYGNIFDHFAVEYEYPGGVTMTSMCRQIDGCASRVDEVVSGSSGVVKFGAGVIEGAQPFKYSGPDVNPYVEEHKHLIEAVRGGPYINEARTVAESTLTAIMGRISAYTGQEVTWEKVLNARMDLSPAAYAMGPVEVPPVAVPGRTKFE